MSCDFIQTQTSLSQNHQIWSPLQRSKVPAFFFGIVFSGQLVIELITIQFYQGSHAFPYRSLKPEAEWESSMSQYARVYMCVCASMHVCTHTQLPWETTPLSQLGSHIAIWRKCRQAIARLLKPRAQFSFVKLEFTDCAVTKSLNSCSATSMTFLNASVTTSDSGDICTLKLETGASEALIISSYCQ